MTEIKDIGIYFDDFFNDCFDAIKKEHNFQSLTESNKPNNAFRKGIYITPVNHINNEYHFNLLRCSSNFDGPTDNFRETDKYIVDKLNKVAKEHYNGPAQFNHILAQIYENTKIEQDNNVKEKKASIKAHSDKTKDMPINGLMAFCTFYDREVSNIEEMTSIQFKLKDCVADNNLTKKVDIVLKPNSVLIIPLLTNRLYTHEIKPSKLNIDRIPTRMGYVVRCSKTKAVYKDNKTFIIDGDGEHELQPITDEMMTHIKTLYYKENMTADVIHYGNVYTSLNNGDYLCPLI